MDSAEHKKNVIISKVYEKNDIIAKEGDFSGTMYIILKGEAIVYKNYGEPGAVEKALLGKGDFFGEMSLFLCEAYTSSLIARTQVTALCVDNLNVQELFKTQPDFAFSMCSSLCSQLRAKSPLPPGKPHAEAASKPKPEPEGSASAKDNESKPEPEPSQGSKLFPEGHGSYTLPFNEGIQSFFLEKSYTCPLCSLGFKEFTLREHKLVKSRTEQDMRMRYKNIEPMYYDIVTCPQCYCSSYVSSFPTLRPKKDMLTRELIPYRTEFNMKRGLERDTFSIFAEYYLTLLCAKRSLSKPQMTTSKTWLRLSWLYSDCGDENMENFALRKALEEYVYIYERLDVTENQAVQIAYLIGEINYKLGNLNDARKYLFIVKTEKNAPNILKINADIRISDIRDRGKGENE